MDKINNIIRITAKISLNRISNDKFIYTPVTTTLEVNAITYMENKED